MRIVACLSATSFLAYCDVCGELRRCHRYRMDEDLYGGRRREPLLQPCLCCSCYLMDSQMIRQRLMIRNSEVEVPA